MQRRQLLIALGAGALVPLASFGQQQGKVWRIGYLHLRSGPSERDDAFLQALRDLGYVEGHNLRIEYRWTAGNTERLPELAVELARLKVDTVVTSSVLATKAAQSATSTIPIVLAAVSDPVGAGLVKSLARPGGNVTGLSQLVDELAGKRLELLRELLPKVTRISVLASGINPADTQRRLEYIRAAAKQLGIQLLVQYSKGAEDWPRAFETMRRERAQALYVQTGPGTIDNRKLLVEFASRQRLPAIYEVQDFVNAGGLMSYGYNVAEMYRRAAVFVDKIFKGAKPGELPVEQPTKFELLINTKTAKALGLTIPEPILLRADKVIE